MRGKRYLSGCLGDGESPTLEKKVGKEVATLLCEVVGDGIGVLF